ncbi:serine hydroxymethyltransferase 7-like [Iris pallida]|uniref:Serine hydroxymethyltransferase 7-like n=1 Tax=Iris pallida TaxID=29817 RepID=A0AAX6EQM2_IRIPA|nr:serine hydroxymethyltransferase 7-like [Iris pallida]
MLDLLQFLIYQEEELPDRADRVGELQCSVPCSRRLGATWPTSTPRGCPVRGTRGDQYIEKLCSECSRCSHTRAPPRTLRCTRFENLSYKLNPQTGCTDNDRLEAKAVDFYPKILV